ncbi:MG2 domain-containing protein [Stieleria varia]|uniref:A-macroglobulin complement component n=1 Tax=Stieleria varia TaxID=2528005 RepID=A0A5C5ZXM1_9BACT|nr:MG2 domain-containing protein [Stieleria varia]TWT92394.1 A-macroglobulin complement component [Stieleria varia]
MNHMNDHDELMQQLMELHYGLLDDSEAAELRGRIAKDPAVATAWATTLQLAGKITEATKVQPTGDLATSMGALQTAFKADDGRDVNDRDEDALPAHAEANHPGEGGNAGFWITAFATLATAACLAVMVTGYRYQQSLPAAPPAALQVRAQSVEPEKATASHEFRFTTMRLSARGSTASSIVVPASISFSVLSNGSVLFAGESETGPDGMCRVTVPDDVVIPPDSRLKVTANTDGEEQANATIEIPLEPTRCLTYVTVDRPVYRPGETIFFRSLTLNRRSLAAHADVPIEYHLLDPSGAKIGALEIAGVTDRGVGNGSFALPSFAPGGTYKLVAKSLDGFFPDEEREIQVRAYRVPRFKKDLEFRRRSYGATDTVEADFSVRRAEGEVLADATAVVTARVDERVIYENTTRTGEDGTLAIEFKLPEVIEKGVGTLSVMIDDGSVKETQSKSIPIHTGKVTMEFYPEGGYLVDGLDNRVYFNARDSLGEPIEVTGEVLSASGKKVADIQTVRDGMGLFRFVPEVGQRYQVKIVSPLDVTSTPELPAVVENLPVIDTLDGVLDSNEALGMIVRSPKRRDVLVHVVCRGELVGQQRVALKKGDNTIAVALQPSANGVLRVTVLDAQSTPPTPMVERLVFRRSDQELNVRVVSDDGVSRDSAIERSPGEATRLTLQVTDENDRPIAAVLGVSVVDDASLSLDETERPTLKTHFLLTSEVQSPEDLEHANFYLSDDAEAAESLDLLLGTQGWRRFVSGSADQADGAFKEQLTKLLDLDGSRNSELPVQVSNEPVFHSQWSVYQSKMRDAWQALIGETMVLLLLVGMVWVVFVALISLFARRRTASVFAGLLLLVVSGLMIAGCGVPENRVVSTAEIKSDEAGSAMASGEEADMSAAKAWAENPTEIKPVESSAPAAEKPTSEPADLGGRDDEAKWSDLVDAGRDMMKGMKGMDGFPMNELAGDFAGQAFEDRSDMNAFGGPGLDMGMGMGNAMGQGMGLDPVANRQQRFREQLSQYANSRGISGKDLANQLLAELRFPVREYAHQHQRPDPEVRSDFAETLYWNPLLITDSRGKATIRFDVSDSVTLFRVNIDGHTTDGRIGSGDAEVVSRLPFQIEPKLPLEVTSGDRIDLPVAVVNATKDEVDVSLDLVVGDELSAESTAATLSGIAGLDRTRQYFPLFVGSGHNEKTASIEIRGRTAAPGGQVLKDNIRRTLKISPRGYPMSSALSGTINESAEVDLPIPRDIVPGSLAVTLRVYPSRLADLMSGVEGILQEPHGCFEQTSATNYPNTMALLLMKQNGIAKPEITRKATGMLERGYGKLTSFECQQLGYEWFGSDPGHEALSAFGLMQFADMQQVMQVDTEMVQRTRTWLMSRRDGKGGFHRNPRHLHVWSVQQEIVNAYVMWALTEADVASGQPQRSAREMAKELDEIQRVAQSSEDAYLIALSAATLMNAGRVSVGEKLLNRLGELQADDGGLDGATTVVSSGGISRQVETTSLAILAWLKSKQHVERTRRATMWLLAHRQSGSGFGSTQATVLALKALVGAGKLLGNNSSGSLQVQLGDETIGQASWSTIDSGDAIEIRGLGDELLKRLSADRETESVALKLLAPGCESLAFSIDIVSHAETPISDASCPLKLTTEFVGGDKATSLTDGATATVRATLVNTTDAGQPMAVAVVGLPGGVEPKMEELDELQEAGQFDYYELRGRDVVFYWRTLEPSAKKTIDFTVTATVPGSYTGPASRTYLYYTAEAKNWTAPLKVETAR